MQTNSVLLASKQQHVYFVTSSDSGLVRPLGLIKISCNILYTSVRNMTSLLLWNYVCDPWKLSRNNGFNSTTAVGNLAHSLVVVISRKIGLLFSAMEHDMRELLRCLERDCSYRDEKWRERFVLHAIKNFFQSSWRFLKFSGMYIQIETFMYAITCHKKRRVKYQTEMLTRTLIAKTAIPVKRSNYKHYTTTWEISAIWLA